MTQLVMYHQSLWMLILALFFSKQLSFRVVNPRRLSTRLLDYRFSFRLFSLSSRQASLVKRFGEDSYTMLSFYRFFPVTSPEEVAARAKALLAEEGVNGTMYVANEGINGAFSVRSDCIVKFRDKVSSIHEGLGPTHVDFNLGEDRKSTRLNSSHT